MSKRLILILALAFVVGITVAAYAEVQNVKVSGDLLMEAVSRRNLKLTDSNLNSVTGDSFEQYGQNYIRGALSHVRVRIDADLTDNVATTVRLLNERTWDEETNASTDIDLDLAYVTLKEFLYSPLTLTVGRQELAFGNQLIIGDPDTNCIAAGHTGTNILPKPLDDLSVRKAFDAFRATLDYDPLVVDFVYAKMDENSIDVNDDVDLYGLNANYALDNNTTVEAYYWEKRRAKAGAATNKTGSGSTGAVYSDKSNDDRVQTLGARVAYTGVENLVLGVEAAHQFGTKVNNTTLYPDDRTNDGGIRDRSANALQLTSTYNLSNLIEKYEPVARVSYTFLSGDKYKNDGPTYRGWDGMYENQLGGSLLNKIVGFSNCHLINLGTSLTPMEDVKLALDYYYVRLAKSFSGGGITPTNVNLTGVAGDPTYVMKTNEKYLASEIDAAVTYDYTEDVQLGLNLGWFVPGSAFDNANDNTASQIIGSMKVTF